MDIYYYKYIKYKKKYEKLNGGRIKENLFVDFYDYLYSIDNSLNKIDLKIDRCVYETIHNKLKKHKIITNKNYSKDLIKKYNSFYFFIKTQLYFFTKKQYNNNDLEKNLKYKLVNKKVWILQKKDDKDKIVNEKMNKEQENEKIKEIRIISIFMLINLIYNTNPNKTTENKNLLNSSNSTINSSYGGNPIILSQNNQQMMLPYNEQMMLPYNQQMMLPYNQQRLQIYQNNLPEENFYDYYIDYIANTSSTNNNLENEENTNIVLERKIEYDENINKKIKKKEKEIKEEIKKDNINNSYQYNLDTLRNELYILKKKASINFILNVIQNFEIYDIVTEFFKLKIKYNIKLYSINFNEISLYVDNMINYRTQINNMVKDIKKKMKFNNKKYYEIKELKII